MRLPRFGRTGRFFVSAFAMDFGGGMYVVALPYLAMSLGAESLQLGIIGAARSVTYMASCVLAALLADRFSRRDIVWASVTVMVGVLLLTVATTSLWHLFAVVLLWGFVLSFFWPSVLSWAADAHRPAELGRATSAINMGWSLGYMVSGAIAGWLFRISSALPILLAALPTLIAGAVLFNVPHHRPRRPAQAQVSAPPPGATFRLLAGWLGNASVCCMFGLAGGVFPRFGTQIGVGVVWFGVLTAIAGLTRTAVFAFGFLGASWPRSWQVSAFSQLVAAVLVAALGLASGPGWVVPVFVALGASVGAAFCTSLYTSLEGARARGMKSALHEATLVAGILIGTVGGGGIAHVWGLRAPYVPIALLSCLLVAAQVALNRLARLAAEREQANA